MLPYDITNYKNGYNTDDGVAINPYIVDTFLAEALVDAYPHFLSYSPTTLAYGVGDDGESDFSFLNQPISEEQFIEVSESQETAPIIEQDKELSALWKGNGSEITNFIGYSLLSDSIITSIADGYTSFASVSFPSGAALRDYATQLITELKFRVQGGFLTEQQAFDIYQEEIETLRESKNQYAQYPVPSWSEAQQLIFIDKPLNVKNSLLVGNDENQSFVPMIISDVKNFILSTIPNIFKQ